MSDFSFKQFLNIYEDLQQEIAKLSSDIALIDTQITQRTQPLTQRKAQLAKLLAIKQQQKQNQPAAPTPPQSSNVR